MVMMKWMYILVGLGVDGAAGAHSTWEYCSDSTAGR